MINHRNKENPPEITVNCVELFEPFGFEEPVKDFRSRDTSAAKKD
ncbi:hypothetical protein ACFL3C_01335 [Patescibacteria group bacterium]